MKISRRRLLKLKGCADRACARAHAWNERGLTAISESPVDSICEDAHNLQDFLASLVREEEDADIELNVSVSVCRADEEAVNDEGRET